MNNDRLKFRVWDNRTHAYVLQSGQYYGFMIDSDGKLHAYRDVDYCFEFDPVDTITDPDLIVEQCTGLRDKNGNLIYEGDIVIKKDTNALGYGRTRKCAVHWQQDWAEWAITTEFGDTYALAEFASEQLEIIGNIHEQKER